jgi:hypothetical protein
MHTWRISIVCVMFVLVDARAHTQVGSVLHDCWIGEFGSILAACTVSASILQRAALLV